MTKQLSPLEALQTLIDNLEYPCNEEYDIIWNTHKERSKNDKNM